MHCTIWNLSRSPNPKYGYFINLNNIFDILPLHTGATSNNGDRSSNQGSAECNGVEPKFQNEFHSQFFKGNFRPF